ncbi:hypothetical protein [Dysosmobacter sp.]
MFSKAVIDSMRDNFNEKFGRLSERSSYLKEAVSEAKSHISGIGKLTAEQADTLETDLWAIMSSASTLGYYIGLQEGADMVQSLSSPELPERMLEAFGELNHYAGRPL